MSDTVKYLLDETRIPKDWYNIVADLPRPPEPVLHPGTLQPVGPQDLEPLFPMALIQQEVSAERTIEIPEPVREVYRQWRPSPLYRARRLEKALDTPARIYYKYEGVSPAGSHKPNTAVAAGLLQQGSRRQAADHRDRRRAVGLRPRLRGCGVRSRRARLHGQSQLRSEALPQGADGGLGCRVRGEPEQRDECRAAHPCGTSELARQPGDRHQRSGGGRRPARRYEIFARQRPQSRVAAPDRDRPGSHGAAGDGG